MDIAGAPAWFQKPQWIAGKWRSCRVERLTGKKQWITVQPPRGFPGGEFGREHQAQARDVLVALALKEKAAAEREREAATTAYIETGDDKLRPIALRDAVKEWLEYKAKTGSCADVVYNQRVAFEAHVISAWGAETEVHSLEPRHVRDLMVDGTPSKLAITTRFKLLSEIAGFFDFACDGGHCSANPVKAWRVPPDWKRQKRERSRTTIKVTLREEEVRMLLAVASERAVVHTWEFDRVRNGQKERVHMSYRLPEGLYMAAAIAVLTGLRRSNVLGLRWGDLDLREGQEYLHVEAARMKSRMEFYVPLNAELARALRAWRRKSARVPAPTEHVLHLKGLQHDFSKTWARLVEKTKERNPETFNRKFRRFHDMRTTFCSLLCGATGLAAESVIVRRLRGDTLGSVAESYSRDVDPRVLREALNKLPRLLETPEAESQKKLAIQ